MNDDQYDADAPSRGAYNRRYPIACVGRLPTYHRRPLCLDPPHHLSEE